MAEVDGVMRMRRLPDGIEIPAGARVALKPGAEHLMFFNPEPAFAEGEAIPVTLRFDGDELIQVEFGVADRSGKPAEALDALDRLAMLGAVDAAFQLLRAQTLGALERRAEAVAAIEAFIDLKREIKRELPQAA